ncbi:VanZ family protein [Paenibacillus sp. D2_2]|uniref:VanZ family protein n=1 Tax=Paenibacillus sp. D2_2 TaxID=3073092 RepID=UPI0028152F76|nr:VanZ family protein [Paenibacillus sp. D2_2]WMT40155.1 VanZ family protein [Paenibacillus sp. D2_2]
MFVINLVIKSLCGFIAILPMVLIFQFVILKSKKNNNKTSVAYTIMTYLFCFFLAGMLSVTGIPSVLYSKVFINLNLIPFRDITFNFIQYIENIILFIPFGLFLPLLWKKFENPYITWTSGLLMSLAIEVSQLFNYRATDIDDLLMNTLGTIIGYLGFVVLKEACPQLTVIFRKDDNWKSGREAYVYIFISWIAMFFYPTLY